MDTVVDKSWHLHRLTARIPVEIILTATAWLEEKHNNALGEKIAAAVALASDGLRLDRRRPPREIIAGDMTGTQMFSCRSQITGPACPLQ
jgi:hypothetical protein